MLEKFEVSGFKNFKTKYVLDLSQVKNYEYNTHLIKNSIVKVAAIFGKNSSGKSNLGLALFDVINHLTDDKSKTIDKAIPYINLDSKDQCAKFKYIFKFDKDSVEYSYEKSDEKSLICEKLLINGEKVAEYDFNQLSGFCYLKGTENLNTILETNQMSFIKYVLNNSVLADDKEKNIIRQFMEYINSMLLFYSLKGNKYYGYTEKSDSLSDAIVRKEKLEDFEKFLNDLDIPCKLISKEIDGKYEIFNEYEYGVSNFFSIASTGTLSLALFYYWLISSQDASLIFMDEFDAFYHYELAEKIVKHSIENRPNSQVIFTSHNINLMNNETFRPDCLFLMQKQEIKPISLLTQKELRYAHNLQKMYRSGAFEDEQM